MKQQVKKGVSSMSRRGVQTTGLQEDRREAAKRGAKRAFLGLAEKSITALQLLT